MAKVLIIDDDSLMGAMLARTVQRLGHEAVQVPLLHAGLERIHSEDFDIVFLDIYLPDGNGLEALPAIRSSPAAPEVIIITGLGDPDGAALAIKNGAWDYIQKPSSIEGMSLPLIRALQYREEKKARKAVTALKRTGIIGSSAAIGHCLDQVAQVAASDINVLITGPTGTGKELFARAIHQNSTRAEKNFVVVDCAAIPENLAESTLFGYAKGAFTGADRSFDGLVKQADGGTLFLDEVGELPLSIQKVFLRVLQERRFRPLRGEKEIRSDFRLVAASNRDLEAMSAGERFRKDLLFRLQSFTIALPPLKERTPDLQELTMQHITDLCRHYGTEIKGFSPDFFAALNAYDWPGNVRELFHALDGAFAVARQDPILYPHHLPSDLRIQILRASLERQTPPKESSQEPPPAAAPARAEPDLPPLQSIREEALGRAEKRYLQDLLTVCGGDIPRACERSGLSRARLYGLLKKYSLSPKA
jgi:two-component system NtrC family response regulator